MSLDNNYRSYEVFDPLANKPAAVCWTGYRFFCNGGDFE